MNSSVEINNVNKSYLFGDVNTPVLTSIDLEISNGDFVTIVGPSGSGKSTLLNIIGCLDQPDTGSLKIQGKETAKMSRNELADVRNRSIGFIFQSFNLIKRISVLENVMLPLIYRGLTRAFAQTKALMELDKLGLASMTSRFPNQLSGGQQQRVAIARALIGEPAILLADEPTGNLDSVTGNTIMSTLEELNQKRGLTLIVVTHDRELAARGRRIITVQDGKVFE